MAPRKPKPYYRRKPLPTFAPSKHNHVGQMIFDEDFCCCRGCEQAWLLTSKGWVPQRPHAED